MVALLWAYEVYTVIQPVVNSECTKLFCDFVLIAKESLPSRSRILTQNFQARHFVLELLLSELNAQLSE